MSLYLDPDSDQARNGPLYDMPEYLSKRSESMHAAAIVIGTHGIILRGKTGSGKSVLQRSLRAEAEKRGLYSALVSDDYLRVARPPSELFEAKGEAGDVPPLIAFAPIATGHLQEVRGLGVLEVSPTHSISRAVMHLLVDIVDPSSIVRMPDKVSTEFDCLGYPIPRLEVPQRSAIAACDLIFAQLSTWNAAG